MTIEAKTTETAAPRIRLGMVGGGAGAFIGGVHRMAARLDNRFELVAGALSSSAEKAQASGRELGLAEDRIYSSYKDMAIREARLKNGIEAVSIVTPNHVHYEAAKEFLRRGIHVICDKPLTSTLADAKKLKKVADESGALFVLTHNYTGYPMVRQAREMIANGDLGDLRVVQVEYAQDWLTEAVEATGAKGAVWRTDPAQSGLGGATGDIGTHAWHLCEYVTGLKVEELCAELNTFVPGRMIDDDGTAFLRLEQGAKALLSATQIAIGEANKVNIRVYGDGGGLQWIQENPNELRVTWGDKPEEIVCIGNNSYLGGQALWNTRTPAGHPEGFIEAFANIYRNFSLTVKALQQGETPTENMLDFPNVNDGVRGMQFIETVVKSGYSDSPKWVKWT